MANQNFVNRAAPLKNVAAFSTLIAKVVERRPDLPGMACFSGPSGLGKTKSAIYGANAYQAVYVECDQFTTAKSLLSMILRELGVNTPKGTVTNLIEQAVFRMSADPHRPLIVDEAHHVAHKRFIDLLRTLHDKSGAPVIVIGEETLPKQLEQHERVHNRMLDWVQAVPVDMDDFKRLAKVCCPNVDIATDLAEVIVREMRGNTRRIVVNLARVEEVAAQIGRDTMDLDTFGGTSELVTGRAPMPRRIG